MRKSEPALVRLRRLLFSQSKRVRILTLLDLAGLAGLFFLLAERFPNRSDMFLNLFSEMAGAFVTYILLVLILERTEDIESEKARLIGEMGSRVQDVAVAATEKLRQRGWLTDGSLQGANLWAAKLAGANLYCARLQEANLAGANMKGANLHTAKLQEAFLNSTDLQGASLWNANFQGAYLGNAQLENARLDGTTTLPDGTKWTPDTDMARFTDPGHPEFWQPEWV